MRAAALTPTAGFAAAGLTGVGQIGHPGLVWLGFWDGEREREAANALAGSARCAEAAESKRGGEGRRASSDELMRWRESEKERGRESASFLSPQRSSGGGRARRNGGESTTRRWRVTSWVCGGAS